MLLISEHIYTLPCITISPQIILYLQGDWELFGGRDLFYATW
jgi:hypothetical protein